MKSLHKLLIFVVAPLLVACIYFGLWATDMYVSETQFTLRSPEGNNSLEWLALFGQAGGSTNKDAHLVQRYIESAAMAVALDKELDLKSHYQRDEADFWSRLKDDPSKEELAAYFNRQVSIKYDQVSGIMTLAIRAFDPEFAQKIVQTILTRSEDLVNRLSERGIEDSIALSQHEVERAEKRLLKARIALRDFRDKHDLLDPQAQAGALQGMVNELEGELTKVRTELAEARTYMRDDSARIVALKARKQALEQQIVREQVRLTGKSDDAINSIAAGYEALMVEHEFAQKQYVSASASLEAARIRAESQNRYLVAFVQPTRPEEALWPRRGYAIGISALVILLVYSMGSLIVATVREHAGV